MYIDAMVARLKTGQTLYVQHDANFNATAITNTSGVVQERFVYDAYGAATFLDPGWAVDSGGSDFGWIYLNQGLRHESQSNTDDARNRLVRPDLGRPLQVDPIGYPDGMNRYEWERSNPAGRLDPFGLLVPVAAPVAANPVVAAGAGYLWICHKIGCLIGESVAEPAVTGVMQPAIPGMGTGTAIVFECAKPQPRKLKKCIQDCRDNYDDDERACREAPTALEYNLCVGRAYFRRSACQAACVAKYALGG